MNFKITCPSCGEELEVHVDLSCGVPSETGTECLNCGAIPKFAVSWEPNIWLDGFIGYEREPKSGPTTNAAELATPSHPSDLAETPIR